MPSRPTAPEKRRIFTGWRVVASSSVVWALQSMLWVQGFGNLAVELRDRFDWSKTFFSIAFGITRYEGALLGPLQGNWIGRFGVARIMRIGSVWTALGFVALSQISTKAGFLIVMIFLTPGVSLAGFLTITASTVRWFERKRARALSIQTMGFAIGGFAAPIVVLGYATIGWRWTMAVSGIVLGLAGWVAASVCGLSPADTGEPVDGIYEPDTSVKRAEGVSDHHLTVHQAVRTRAFWMISLGHGSALLVVSASMAHLALYLTEDRGLSAGRAAVVAGLVPAFQLLGTGLGGFLGDRMNKRLIAGVAMTCHGVGLLTLVWVETNWAIGIFVVLHGLAWGARGPQMQAIRADYFGSTSFASIMGWSSLIVTLGAVTGPLVAGILADSTGNYRLGFTIIGIAAIAGTTFWAFATPPETRPPDR